MPEHFEKMARSVPAPLDGGCANWSCRRFWEEKVEVTWSSSLSCCGGAGGGGPHPGLVATASASEPVASGEE